WPGLGKWAVRAVVEQDVTVINGTVLLSALLFIVLITVIDILYAFIDPRIRYD
ncbi:MAG: ABC transporter permease subunit, partial [Deinococcus sp.]|nr:ABC transporter permease subunit [Deinococcus sp.]